MPQFPNENENDFARVGLRKNGRLLAERNIKAKAKAKAKAKGKAKTLAKVVCGSSIETGKEARM